MARREPPDPDLDEVLPRRLPPLPFYNPRELAALLAQPKMRSRPADKMLRRHSDKANANEKGT